jgi:hypothetical protein
VCFQEVWWIVNTDISKVLGCESGEGGGVGKLRGLVTLHFH